MSWACVGPFGAHVGPMFGPTLGHMEVLVGLCWARYSQYVGQEGFWCPTNLVSDSGHVGHNGVTFAMVRVCVRPMLGLCWPMLGYSDGWVGLCWPDIPIFVGRKCQGFGAQIWCLTVVMLGLLGHDFGNPVHFGNPNASKCPYIYIYICMCIYIYIYIKISEYYVVNITWIYVKWYFTISCWIILYHNHND